MTATEIIAAARVQLDDEFENYKWSTASLVDYLNDSLNTVARETGFFIDTYTTSIINISLVAHTQDYAYSANIEEIIDARVSGETVSLAKTNLRELNEAYPEWRWVTTTNENDSTPTHYLVDYRTGYISLYPTPSANGTLVLQTIRKSSYTLTSTQYITDFTTATVAGTPDLKSEYHFGLIDGICYRAYLKSGQHTYDQKKSRDHFQLFMKMIDAIKRDLIRLRDKNDIARPHPGAL